MNYTIEQLLSFIWQWVYPHDLGYVLRMFTAGYIVFFTAFALGRGSLLSVTFIVAISVGIQAALLTRITANPFSFPTGPIYPVLGVLPCLLAGIVLARATTYPFISLWINIGDAFSSPNKKNEDFSVIDSAKVFALRAFIFITTLAVTPVVFLTKPKWVQSRYNSQQFATYLKSAKEKRALTTSANRERVLATLRKASKVVVSNPLQSLTLAVLHLAVTWLVLTKFFPSHFSNEIALEAISRFYVDVFVFSLFVSAVASFAAAKVWLKDVEQTGLKSVTKWPRELKNAAIVLDAVG